VKNSVKERLLVWVVMLAGLLVVLAIGAVVVWSILGDADMLLDAGGWWMLLLFLVVPALIGLYALNEEQSIRARWRGWRQLRRSR
jgi:hypothetical protein